ncbi:hypothetical protein KTO58_21230 [Chitinophaga pendula]|uniref:DUF928 domain-containing protein n=1 Tax=Chitinophaga TaxID=79328 RepID=UPI0012FD342E|nr:MULTISPECIES: DUF928 domain-containing protein [Chitinophaga]UCJ06173.1 hypothetical protein KTO58_21230 [Chitinophaga pendula]
MMKRIILLLLVQLSWLTSFCQVSFVFLPEVHGRTLDGLMMTRVVNAAGSQRVILTITVTEQQSGRVLQMRTNPFPLTEGTQSLPPALIRNAKLTFSNNPAATICKQTGTFPEGDYEYCFELTNEDKNAGELIGEQCFNYQLQPFSPLLLMSPGDGDAICDKRPQLYWQPLLPAIAGMQYRLVLTEIKPGQSKVEALNYNTPQVQQMGIPSPMLFFPPGARPLEEGHQYAWQVAAYRGTLLLANSEIWEFTVSCEDSTKALPVTGYRDLEDLTKGNFYIANGSILFSTHNAYAEGPLPYTITCLTNPELKIKKLPKVRLARGANQIIIDLSDNPSFTDGYFYIMTIQLPSGEQKQLRFLYKVPQ